jgi:hypothetical protein
MSTEYVMPILFSLRIEKLSDMGKALAVLCMAQIITREDEFTLDILHVDAERAQEAEDLLISHSIPFCWTEPSDAND